MNWLKPSPSSPRWGEGTRSFSRSQHFREALELALPAEPGHLRPAVVVHRVEGDHHPYPLRNLVQLDQGLDLVGLHVRDEVGHVAPREPPRRLAWRYVADFIPDVKPYEVETLIELHEIPEGVRVVVTFDAMHDDRWTQMARLGRESELERLAKVL